MDEKIIAYWRTEINFKRKYVNLTGVATLENLISISNGGQLNSILPSFIYPIAVTTDSQTKLTLQCTYAYL